MPKVNIREIRGKERANIMYELNVYAFRASPPLADREEWEERFKERKGVTSYALFENKIPVSSAAYTKMSQHVRGVIFGSSAIWGVATRPSARRKGYSRAVLSSLLQVIRDEGRPLSSLYPFRESFYERLGYTTFPLPIIAQFSPSSLTPLIDLGLEGEIELILIGDGYQIYRQYLFDMQSRVHGMGVFEISSDKSAGRNYHWVLLARVEGELVGVMLYNLQGEEVTEFNFRAVRFYYTKPQGRYLLLEWIARHMDQASSVEIWLPPYEQPETWLADIMVTTKSAIRAPMGRVVDVANIGGMEVGQGEFTVRIQDEICPWNEDVWNFTVQDGRLVISRGQKADQELTIQGLSALIFGTHRVDEFSIRGWGNPSKEIQKQMQNMFPLKQPYLHEYF